MELHNNDCFNILPTLNDKSVDLVLVDLPYGQTTNKWDICIDLEKMWEQLKRIGKEKTAFIFFTTTKFGIDLINSNRKWFRYDLVWEKCGQGIGYLNANRMPLRNHEMIYIFYKKLPTYNPQKIPLEKPLTMTCGSNSLNNNYGKHNKFIKTYTDKHPQSILKIKNPNSNNKHPTQKPVEACEWLIKSYSNDGDTVLDFTMGSGTTGVACKNTNRKFIGVEMNEEYFKVAEERIKN
jgi:site-specific DNA-methyltransferase (adenine-specific)